MTQVSPDILDMLVDALVERIKVKLMPEIEKMIAEDNEVKMDADRVQGLEQFIDHSIEEYYRGGNPKVDAEDVSGLEDFIKETMKQATISIDF